jgi:hypothetical protein
VRPTHTSYRLALAVFAALSCASAHADTRRVAVIVGNNAGADDEPPLHYAEADADKLARVLGELGGVAPDDLFVVRGQGTAGLTTALARARERITAYLRLPANRVVVIFYFSGHSDGIALELGRDRWTFAELRRWLAATGAQLRVALVDSCKSGALVAAKGGTRGPAFQIRLADDLASTGEVLLTPSAADEVALESREIGGSYFTHHFVSGLRGAADTSGDGQVTLDEAYRYAYVHTIAATGQTLIGPQHPVYAYRLTGEGELVLTSLAHPSAALELPGGFERALVIDLAHDQVIAELPADARPVLAVQPGRYAVRLWRRARVLGATVTVAAHEQRSVRWNELGAVAEDPTGTKGAQRSRDRALVVSGGVTSGVADRLGAVPSARVELRLAGFDIALTTGTRRSGDFRESSAVLALGYRRGLVRGPWSAWAGIELGGGAVMQTPYDLATGEGVALGRIGAAHRIGDHLSIALDAALGTAIVRRDGRTAAIALPAAWLGFVVPL